MTVGSPQQSTKSFTSPVGVPIKKTPPITDIIHDKVVSEPKNSVQETIQPEVKEVQEIKEEIHVKQENEVNNVAEVKGIETSKDTITFTQHWETLFEDLFKHIPILYFPLKGYIPEIMDNKIHLNLKNQIQKEHFEPKIREVLAYLRTHYSDLIEDVIINVDETVVTRKIIYDTVDKLKNLNEQNQNFEEFNSILNLKVKD